MKYIGGSTDENRRDIFEWMNTRIPGGFGVMPEDFKAIYILDDGVPVGVVGFSNWTVGAVDIHIATDGTKRWASRRVINEVYRYIFETCGRTRLNALVSTDNEPAIRLHKRLGHTYLGLLKHQLGKNKHALAFGWTFEDWQNSRWFPRHKNEELPLNSKQPKQGSISE